MATGILGALVVAYCACFGPLMYVMVFADRHGWVPDGIDQPLMLLFHPHFLVMYQQEWYFDYIAWFLDHAGARGPWNWQDFRESYDHKFSV